MKTKGVISFQNKNAIAVQGNYSAVRAKSFRVKTSQCDFTQYVKTVKAYALAGLPFNHIANAGDLLGDIVERGEIDAPIEDNWDKKIGEVAEDESQILAWQNRGERVSVTHQIAAPHALNTQSLIPYNSLEVVKSAQEEKIDVLEGIKVLKQERMELSEPSSDQELENNPYLKALPQEIKKAA